MTPVEDQPRKGMTLDEVLGALDMAVELGRSESWRFLEPYGPQSDFFAIGTQKRERLFMAGTQTGKSQSGAFETTCHLTGIYPPWWTGKRFDKPTHGWAGGETGELTRDVIQTKLCGPPGVEELAGTGMIPKKLLVGSSLSHGVSGLFDNIQVRHVSGGVSILHFKAYVQGRARWQGATLDFVWMDEEPPADIYSEALARLKGHGMIFTTFTPFAGYSEVVSRFLRDDSMDALRDRACIRMGLKHAAHFTDEEKARRLAGYPAHERAARENGDPMLGSGAVWEDVVPENIRTTLSLSQVPGSWAFLWGLDFGIAHPFAAVLLGWDRDIDCIHVLHAIRMSGGIPVTHAAPMKSIGARVPVAWPHDGNDREKGSGEPLADLYRKQGLHMLGEHATFATGGYSTEAGVADMVARVRTDRFKAAAHLTDWWDEFRAYHRKEGLIVKKNDDLMSATRTGVIAIRHAKPVGLGASALVKRPRSAGVVNPWTGMPVVSA